MPDSPCFQFLTHHLAQRAHGSLADVSNLKHLAVQLIPGSHAADNRNPAFQCLLCQGYLCRHRIDGIDDIVRPLFKYLFQILRKNECLMCSHLRFRADIRDPFFHHFRLIPANRTVVSDGLPVDIGQRDLVIVNQYQPANPASCQRLYAVGAHAPHAKHHDAGPAKL